MRNTEERIRRLHIRANEIERLRERRQLAGLGSASAFLGILLISVIFRISDLSQSLTGDQFTGSSLLSESAGGYVLAAVIAFFAGVIITVLLIRSRRRKDKS